MKTAKQVEKRIQAIEAAMSSISSGSFYAGLSGERFHELNGALAALRWVAHIIRWPPRLSEPATKREAKDR